MPAVISRVSKDPLVLWIFTPYRPSPGDLAYSKLPPTHTHTDWRRHLLNGLAERKVKKAKQKQTPDV